MMFLEFSDSDRARLKRYELKQGDIVFSRVGSVDRRKVYKGSRGSVAIVRTLLTGKDREAVDLPAGLAPVGWQQAAIALSGIPRSVLSVGSLRRRTWAVYPTDASTPCPRCRRSKAQRGGKDHHRQGRPPVQLWTIPGRDGQRKARPGIAPLDAAGNPVALADAAQERNPAEIDSSSSTTASEKPIGKPFSGLSSRSGLFRRNRGTTSHTYNKEKAQEVFESAPDFPKRPAIS